MGNKTNTSSPSFDAFRAAVTQAMAGIAAGDGAARWRLHELSGPSVRAMAFGEARRIGVWLSDDDLDAIHVDVTLDLARRAGSWSSEGALPWVWARRRVLAMVHDHIGQFGAELDDVEDAAPEIPGPVEDPIALLHRMADHDPRVTALLHQLDGASDRDVAIWVDFRLEAQAGNRSPAVTVGADHDMKPAAVRKVVQRVNQRLAGPGPDLGFAA